MCLYDKTITKKSQNSCVLTADQEKALIKKHQQGDPNAAIGLISSVQHVLNYMVRTHRNKNVSEEDLYQECLVAAFRAIDSFDLDSKARLTTYVKFKLWAALNDYINKNAYCAKAYLGKGERKVFFNAAKIDDDPSLTFNERVVKVTKATSVDVKDVETVLGFLSGGAMPYEDTVEHKGDVLESVTKSLAFQKLEYAVSKLNEIQQDIISSFYISNESLTEIAKRYKLSKQGVTNIRNQALERLAGILSPYAEDVVNG